MLTARRRGQNKSSYSVTLIILLGLFLQSCSNQFIYNRIDRIAELYIEHYIDLNREQSEFLKVKLQSLKEWHRRQELQGYRKFLQQVGTDLQSRISTATVAGWAERLQQAYIDIRDKALPDILAMAQTLSDAQVQELAASMEKRNRKLEKKYLARDDTEYHDAAYTEMKDQLGDWLGRLTPQQKQRLRVAANGLKRLDREWMAGRRAWQQKIIAALQRKPGWQARLTGLIKNRTEYIREQDVTADHRNEQRVYAAIADTLNMRTDGQQQTLSEKLQKWQTDLAAMQNSGGKSG